MDGGFQLADLLADMVERCAAHRFMAPYVIEITDATGVTISASFKPGKDPGSVDLCDLKVRDDDHGNMSEPRLVLPLSIKIDEFTGKTWRSEIRTKR